MSKPRGGGGNRSKNNRGPLPRPVQISKKLSWLLRHGAESENLPLQPGGYINLADALSNRNLRGLQITFAEVREIVKTQDKQRFTMIPVSANTTTNGESSASATNENQDVDPSTQPPQTPLESTDPKDYLIRANQGHSIKIADEGLLQPIDSTSIPPLAVHGTTHSAWPSILASGGLKPMGRNHVHFASGLPAGFKSVVENDADGAETRPPVVSGMRASSTILIFLDVGKAMEAGLKFWRSDNGVILSEGDEEGLVPVRFFKRVEDRMGEGVLVENGEVVKEAPAHWGGKGKGRGKG